MKKKPTKKKSKILDIIIGIVFVIIAIMIFLKEDSQINKVNIVNKQNQNNDERSIPQQLRWFDNFKGIDNMNRGNKEEPSNFMEYEKQKNSR